MGIPEHVKLESMFTNRFSAPVGPFNAVEKILWRNQLGPFVNIDARFACSSGPIQSSRKHFLLGPSVNINARFVCSGGPIQSSRKQSPLSPFVNIYATCLCSDGLIQSSWKHS
jgi:hypothetical protein